MLNSYIDCKLSTDIISIWFGITQSDITASPLVIELFIIGAPINMPMCISDIAELFTFRSWILIGTEPDIPKQFK